MAAGLVLLLVRIDVRRPASWLAAGIAAAAVWALASTGPGPVATAAAVACGGWAAVAATGSPPRGIAPGSRATDEAWWWERAAWPLAGGLLAAAGRWLLHGDGGEVAAGLALGVLVATLLAAGAVRRGAPPADAASLGLVAGSAAAGCGLAADTAAVALLAAAVAAAAVMLAAWSGWRLALAGSWPAAADAPPRAALAELALARGGLRAALSAVAMAASPAGMAAWYFLMPEAASLGCLATGAWFAALAVPAAVLAAPAGAAWGRLASSAAAGGPTPWVAWQRPGWERSCLVVAAAHAAVLGWPPLVTALLRSLEALVGSSAAATWPWLAVAVLLAAAVALVGLVAVAAGLGLGCETVLAVAAGAVIACLALVAAKSPQLRDLPKAPWQTGVEKTARLTR